MFGAKVLHKQNHCIFYYTDKIRIFFNINTYNSICMYACMFGDICIYEIIQLYL